MKKAYLLLGSLLLECVFLQSLASAQVVPDSTLGADNSLVSGDTDVRIDGGAQKGGNLFHSFEAFSVPEGGAVLFNNTLDVDRILTRITGPNATAIDGLIEANGTADLYILNPQGIEFLPNASLAIGGSLLVTTGDTVRFDDGSVFGTESQFNNVLTSSVPIGLGLSSESSISIENSGHTLFGDLLTPLVELDPVSGLSSLPGEGLILIGGNISSDGGLLRSPSGHIQIAAIQDGSVEFSQDLESFDYQIEEGGNISLTNSSFFDLRGMGSGSLALMAKAIRMSNGATINNSESVGITRPDSIELVSESLVIDGAVAPPSTPIDLTFPAINSIIPAGLVNDNYGPDLSGTIRVQAEDVHLLNGGLLIQRSFGPGPAGDIVIDSINSISLEGQNNLNPGLVSGIVLSNIGPVVPNEDIGIGTIFINTSNLNLSDGGSILSSTIGQGDTGNIDVTADEILVSSAGDQVFIASAIFTISTLIPATALNANSTESNLALGDAGDINIDTRELRVIEGGQIVSSSNNFGDAGSITIQADDAILLDGISPDGVSSFISSGAFNLAPAVAEFFGFDTDPPTGESGAVSINTPSLTLSNTGFIGVQNEGTGNAGDLLIDAEQLRILSGSTISAITSGGQGGSIVLDSSTTLVDTQSLISASAAGEGTGGNIVINSDAIALLNESTIAANAEEGSGGQVQIQSNTLFQSSSSAITATSEAGPDLDGSVEITVQEESLRTEEQLSQTLEVPSIAVACTQASEEGFAFVGRGGLPLSSDTLRRSWEGWNNPTETAPLSEANQDGQIIEAQGFLPNGDGTVRFVDQATLSSTITASGAACVGKPPA